MPRSAFPFRFAMWSAIVPVSLGGALCVGVATAHAAPALPTQDATPRTPALPVMVAQGTLRDAQGKPVKGALIEVMHTAADTESIAAQAPVTSDEQGSFIIKAQLTSRELAYLRQMEEVKEGEQSFPVVVHAPGLAATQQMLQAAAEGAPTLPSNTLTLRRGSSASGHVVDKDGKPVAGLIVRARYASVGNPQAEETSSYVSFYALGRNSTLARDFVATSDAEGSFTLRDLPLGKLSVTLDDARYTQQSVVIAVSDPPSVVDKPTFTVRPAGHAVGRVLYPDGKPAGGIKVVARDSTRRGMTPTTVTRPDGTYALGSIGDNSVVITASTSSLDYATTSTPAMTVKAGEEIKVADLTLARGALLTGAVKEAGSNAPVAGAIVTTLMEDCEGATAVTDAQGQYQLRAQPGTHTFYLSLAPPDYIGSDKRPEVKVGMESRVAPTFFIRKGQTIKGIALDEKGRPAVGATISVSRNYARAATSRVNTEGEWTLRGIDLSDPRDGRPRGTLHLKVLGSWGLRGNPDFVVPANAPLQPLTLYPITLQDVTVRVLTPDGKPVSGATVGYKFSPGSTDEGERNGQITANEMGEVTFPNLRPEQMAELTAMKAGYALTQNGKIGSFGAINGNTDAATKAGLLRASDIVMTPLDGKVSGRVLDAAGQPAVGVRVACLFPNDLRDLPDTSVLTDAQGRFALKNLPPNEVTIGAARGHAFAQAALHSDDLVPVELKLSADEPVPVPRDVEAAFAQLERWTKVLSHKTGATFGDSALLLATYDADRALRAVTETNGKADQSFLSSALLRVARRDPERAVTLGKTWLSLIEDAKEREDTRIRLSIATAALAPQAARAVYDEVALGTTINTFNAITGKRYVRLAALAAALKDPDADGWLQALTLCVKALPNDGNGYLGPWVTQIAEGDLPTARKWAAQLPLTQQFSALCTLVSWENKRDPTTAHQILRDAQALLARPDFPVDTPQNSHGTPPSERLNGVRAALTHALMNTNMAAAQEVAKELPTDGSTYIVARDQMQAMTATPQDEAAMRATLDDVRDGWFNPAGTEAWLAFLLRENLPQLSAQGFKEARDKLAKRPAFNNDPNGDSVALYAYARASFDPAGSRLLLENEWLRTINTLRHIEPKGDNMWILAEHMGDLARAMIPLDLARANEMLEADPTGGNNNFAYNASTVRAQIIKWLLADAKTRRTMLLPNSGLYYEGIDDLD